MSDQSKPHSDLTALAAEACELWQEHLAACSSDPKLKAEMMRLMEPSRQIFAGWAQMMQTAQHGTGPSSAPNPATASNGNTPGDARAAHARTASSGPASDDSALRLAQLAYRVAEVEKRLARLESKPRRTPSKNSSPSGRGRTG